MTAQKVRNMENATYLEESLRALLPHGYSCYTVNGEMDYCGPSGFIITPGGNILYVYNEYFGGWNFAFEYQKTREHGTGCLCFEFAAYDVSLETVQRSEHEGKCFAMRLKASLYSSPNEWKRSYWAKDRLVPVTVLNEAAGA